LIICVRIGEPNVSVPMGDENIIESFYVRFLIHDVLFEWI